MTRWLLLCGAVAPVLYAFTVLLGARLRPGYSHVRDAVSELTAARTPNRLVISTLFGVYNLLVVGFGLGIYRLAMEQGAGGVVAGIAAAVALVIMGLAGLAMGLAFPQDAGGLPVTSRGRTHNTLAGVISAASIVAMLALALWFQSRPTFEMDATFSYLMAIVVSLSGGAAALMAGRSPVFGCVERLRIGGTMLWLLVVALRLSALT